MKCPYCKQKESAESPFWPFCSDRCKKSDFGAWAKEEYRVAGNTNQIENDIDVDADAQEEEQNIE